MSVNSKDIDQEKKDVTVQQLLYGVNSKTVIAVT